jgi:hypothetical protein
VSWKICVCESGTLRFTLLRIVTHALEYPLQLLLVALKLIRAVPSLALISGFILGRCIYNSACALLHASKLVRTYFSILFDSIFIKPRDHITPILLVHSIIITTDCYRIESIMFEVLYSKDFGAFALDLVAAYSADSQSSFSFVRLRHSCKLWYDTSMVQKLLDNAFPTGISPLLFRVQQSPVSQSGATTPNHGLRVPHLSKRRRDRGQRFGISERSSERHKVSSSLIVRVLLGMSAREQAGVTTDLAQDPTLVRRLCYSSFPYIHSLLDSRHTLTSLAQTAVMRSALFYPLGWSTFN